MPTVEVTFVSGSYANRVEEFALPLPERITMARATSPIRVGQAVRTSGIEDAEQYRLEWRSGRPVYVMDV